VSTERQSRQFNLIDPLEPTLECKALDENSFRRVMAIERKRTERSKSPFVLVLIEVANLSFMGTARALEAISAVLLASSRDTDVVGWYREGRTVGGLYTGLDASDKQTILNTIRARVSSVLQGELTFEQFDAIRISLHFFPDDWDGDNSDRPSDSALYPDLTRQNKGKQPQLIMKRAIDIVFGCLLALLCLPVCLIIAIAIKLTSKGPVLYKQQRVGQYGRQFTFLKFRSMYANNDHSVHKDFVTKMIANKVCEGENGGVYKLTRDSRITPLGRFLRKTSLDELPQFLNVLKGEMSLVGPRPPIPYELAAYQTWHRRRLLEVKPGITGLWQVTGRCRVGFDEMVRLDLKYAMLWSPWLDMKILLRTPAAVVKGSGAY
jgi:lipopolysaccharide/colanic/teichoic acid biosynthesis glycosyltransferase